jgi:hypothetical protein
MREKRVVANAILPMRAAIPKPPGSPGGFSFICGHLGEVARLDRPGSLC